MSFDPAWVMVGIAAGGVVFQGGVGWATLNEVKGLRKKSEHQHSELTRIDKRVDQHEWRITNHDSRINHHDTQIDKLREGAK